WLVVLLCLPGTAGSEEVEDAGFREQYNRALAFYQARRYEEALAALEAAYAIRPDPRLLLNLGHACRRLGRNEEALEHYRRYQEQMPSLSPAEAAAVAEYMALARRALARAAPVQPPPQAITPAPTPAQTPPSTPVPTLPPASVPPASVLRPAPLPLYQRWWFWGVVGIVAVGTVTAAVLGAQPWDPNLPPGARIHDPKF
ncbi:MAG: tetratricopeptide repeat-containing protein, partial [Myxococcota bacterium]|nr:tetratricopeptide repeat-containing protein [Myxococcota bacterium]